MPDYLPEDIKRQQNENSGRLVPTTGEVGYFLAVTGLSPFSYAFRQGPDEEIPRFPGNPDGELTAPIDSLVRNTVDHTVWINTDGDTAWEEIGTGGGFPLTNTDGVETQEILADDPTHDGALWLRYFDTGVTSADFLLGFNDSSWTVTRTPYDAQVELFTDAGGAIRSGFRVRLSGSYVIDAGRDSSSALVLGFFGASPVTKPTVTGSRGGNAALASLLTALEDLGLIVDGSS